MPPPFPSIQSFFDIQSSPQSKAASSSIIKPGDGFKENGVDPGLHLTRYQSGMPTQEYEELDISSLVPGPKCVTFMGRIANLYNHVTPSKRPRAARGCLKIIVKDDTGALMVRLWYANKEYKLYLGQLVSVWTPHVSNGEMGSLAPPSAPLFTSIFPERDRCCHIMVHENSDVGVRCRTPLGFRRGQALPNLMSVKNFVQGGYEVHDGRILVCVKSIGARKKFTNANGSTSEFVQVGVFDASENAMLTLWGAAMISVSAWKPSKTVLLITNPGVRTERTTRISLTSNTHVDVDPNIPDAAWLRSFAKRLTKREHVNPPFPEAAFNVKDVESSALRILYTLADLDNAVRANPQGKFVGYLSLVIMDVKLATLHRRGTLMCTECCGIPLYANTIATACKQCSNAASLSPNPRILGSLIDETGTIDGAKLILSSAAWTGLLGRSPADLCHCDAETLRDVTCQLMFMRITFCFGWEGYAGSCQAVDERKQHGNEDSIATRNARVAEGRLCIWGVRG